MATKHIFKQIWAERGRNGWIFAELMIVFCLSWYLVDSAFVMIHNRSIPRGFDISDTYSVVYGKDVNDSNRADYEQFCEKIRRFPGVQTMYATIMLNVMPFEGAYYGGAISVDSLTASFDIQQKPISSNDYFKVFRIHSVVTGEISGFDYAQKDGVILTEGLAKSMFGDDNPIGQKVRLYSDDSSYRVVDVVSDQKRYDFYQPGNIVYQPMSEVGNEGSSAICFRAGDNFDLEKFKDEIIEDVESFDDVSRNFELMTGVTKGSVMRIFVMAFFFLNIALGIIGTFWFRNQARRSEIGIRLALGAGKRGVTNYYIVEALILLTLAAIPAIAINVCILQADLIKTVGEQFADNPYITSNKWLRFLTTNAITYVVLAIIVAVSAWIPAHRASKINPVEALKDE